jgi:putative component of membrane protein insertase Oxa1/YidC/SpoIIIJ protein YidD
VFFKGSNFFKNSFLLRRIQGPESDFSRGRRAKADNSLGKTFLFWLVAAILALPLSGFGEEPFTTLPASQPSSLLSLGIEGYQKILSPVLDSKCYMQPSCSAYAKQALSDYGPLLGLLLTIDRLFREANEDRTSPLVRQGKELKLYDPPAANVWWEK